MVEAFGNEMIVETPEFRGSGVKFTNILAFVVGLEFLSSPRPDTEATQKTSYSNFGGLCGRTMNL